MKLLSKLFISTTCAMLLTAATVSATEFSDAQVKDLVRRSYPYVAMYNVNNKFAMDPNNPSNTGGWNKIKANTTLLDHTMQAIARPNNDTLYAAATLDLRSDAVILEAPAFDSKYVSLMVTGYDHHVNIPMSTQRGDFKKPSRILFYSKRTRSYQGGKFKGVDKIAEMTCDFVSAVYRVMPHQTDPERMQRNIEAMKNIKVVTLSEYRGGKAKPVDAIDFPPYGETDFDIFQNNLLEVMQFVFNHTTFDNENPLDKALLAIYSPLGVAPGRRYDPAKVAAVNGQRIRKAAEAVAKQKMDMATDPEFRSRSQFALFQPKGKMELDILLFQSVIGPIGLPASEAVYAQIPTREGKPINAMHDYVIRMKKSELPPANAFWSVTLYDLEHGFFIPNDRKKYSVGENGGMQLAPDGGIAIYIAAQKPHGVAEENWLPINRGDYDMDAQLRIYAPDIERYKKWTLPQAEMLE